jgi:endonuclease/exonuclease/phosphatase family metal-dependent hydrolase
LLVLTWNLFHGRAVPPAGRDLLGDFAALLAGWEWDVALLQEVPPWWPPALARAAGARAARTALTSRNAGLGLRRPLAQRRPDLMKSNGGGANAILVRGDDVREHRRRRLRCWPERRVVHAVRLASGPWAGNVHAQVHSEQRAQADVGVACECLRDWSAGAPFVLGGDLNVRVPAAPGLLHAAGHGVDHVLASGFGSIGHAHVPDRATLSDHAPLLVELREEPTPPVRQEKT